MSGTSVTYEELPWHSRISPDYLPQRQRDVLTRPYRASVTPSIARLEISFPDELVEKTTDAQGAIIRFDSDVGHITAPFASILLRSESASSSEIENLSSSAKAIAEAQLGERQTGNAPLIVANVRALEAAVAAADELTEASIIGMHRQLLESSHPEITGGFRTEQVWIGGGNYGPHDAEFVPPHHGRVPGAIDDFIEYSLRPSPLPLAAIAIAHAQFETIHPFPDGNGRTGRALVQAALRRSGMTRGVMVPVSAGILQIRDQYFDALTAYRNGDVAPIVDVFADGAFLAIANGSQLVADITSALSEWQDALGGVRADAAAWRILALALEQPVLNSRLVRDRITSSDPALFNALDLLVERGVLVQTTSARRNRMWAAPKVLAALDAFARRSQRR